MGPSRHPSSLLKRFSRGGRLWLFLAASAVVAIGLGFRVFTGPLFHEQTWLHVLFIFSLTAFLVSVVQLMVAVSDIDEHSPVESVDDRNRRSRS